MAECGTTRGYNQHREAGEEPCPECLEAWRAYWLAYWHGRHDRDRPPPTGRRQHGCGTYAGYKYHLIHGEEPCPPCLEAGRAYNVEVNRRYRARKKAAAASA